MKDRGVQFWVLAVIGAGALLNAVAMLADSERWFAAVAHHAGVFNVHLIRDVAFAYAATGVALLWGAFRPALRRPLCAVAGVFLVLHAVGHVYETATGALPPAHWLEDAPGVYLPALLVGWIALRRAAPGTLASPRAVS